MKVSTIARILETLPPDAELHIVFPDLVNMVAELELNKISIDRNLNKVWLSNSSVDIYANDGIVYSGELEYWHA